MNKLLACSTITSLLVSAASSPGRSLAFPAATSHGASAAVLFFDAQTMGVRATQFSSSRRPKIMMAGLFLIAFVPSLGQAPFPSAHDRQVYHVIAEMHRVSVRLNTLLTRKFEGRLAAGHMLLCDVEGTITPAHILKAIELEYGDILSVSDYRLVTVEGHEEKEYGKDEQIPPDRQLQLVLKSTSHLFKPWWLFWSPVIFLMAAGDILGAMLEDLQAAKNSQEIRAARIRVTLQRLLLLRAVNFLKEGVRVFNPLAGLDLSPGIFGNSQWIADQEMTLHKAKQNFHQAAAYLNEQILPAAPFFPRGILTHLGDVTLFEFNVLEEDLLSAWSPHMRKNDLIFWKFTHQFLMRWDTFYQRHMPTMDNIVQWEKEKGRMKTWVRHFVEGLPEGIHLFICEDAVEWNWPLLLDGAPSLASYLIAAGLVEPLEPFLFSAHEQGLLEVLNRNSALSAEKMDVLYNALRFGTGGSIYFLRRTQAFHERNETSLAA